MVLCLLQNYLEDDKAEVSRLPMNLIDQISLVQIRYGTSLLLAVIAEYNFETFKFDVARNLGRT